MAETSNFFEERWREDMKAYVAAYKSLQKPKWKLGDIASKVDKGSRKAFWGVLYDKGRIDMSHAEFDHYLQTSIAFPEDKRVLTKSWSLHFKLRNLPDRFELIQSDKMRRVADADELLKARKLEAEQTKEEEDAAAHRNEDKDEDITFYEVWDVLRDNAQNKLQKWLGEHVNYDLDMEMRLKVRRDSHLFCEAWLEAVDSDDYEDPLELGKLFGDIINRERIPF